MKARIGKTVVMRSGGAWMTISRILKDGRVQCMWFDERRKVHTARFQMAVLTPVMIRTPTQQARDKKKADQEYWAHRRQMKLAVEAEIEEEERAAALAAQRR